MYLRPDEVARVLEKVGFTVDVVTQKAYGYRPWGKLCLC
ncbi:protein [Escherichia coli]|uniref:Protein n=1 Tax=Escherichia coli TaxID=562 RepID=A0A2X1KBG7_ECOLX|nr:protein [Escherichia coli]